MSTNYPSVGIDNFGADRVDGNGDGTKKIPAADINNPRHAIVAIETELGLDPAGTDTSVKVRLDRIENGGIAKKDGTLQANLNADKLDGYDVNTGTTANTIPVRDANGNIPGTSKMAVGTYTGDGTANRAINVGLNNPKLINIYGITISKSVVRITSVLVGCWLTAANVSYLSITTGTNSGVISAGTAISATGFVTGTSATDANSLNVNTTAYYWEAWS